MQAVALYTVQSGVASVLSLKNLTFEHDAVAFCDLTLLTLATSTHIRPTAVTEV